jgi:hypothetical protein
MLDDEDGAFAALFPEEAPLSILTRPRMQPTVQYDGPNDANATVEDLGLDFYAEVDGRKARVLGLDLDIHAGLDLELDPATGTLDIPVDVDPANVETTVTAAELTPGEEEAIQENFAGLLQTILETVAGSLLQGLSYALPSYNGFGLTSLETAPAGAQADWLGLFAQVGEVAYSSKGCGEDGGCSGGCSGAGLPGLGRWLLAGVAGLVIARRRR